MTYGFFLKVTLSPYGRFQSDETTDQEIALPPPIGIIRYRGAPQGTSFTEASAILFSGTGYEAYDDAETAGKALKSVVQLASIDAGIAIDAGLDIAPGGGPAQPTIDTAAAHGVLLLPNIHGLQIFEETGRPAMLSISVQGVVTSPLPSFATALVVRSHRTTNLDAKHSLACHLYGLSRFEESMRSRLLTLVTALDVLSDTRSRTGVSLQVVTEILALAKKRMKEARSSGYDQEELAQLSSLVSAVGGLRNKSIAASLRELAKGVSQDALWGPMSPDEIIDQAYRARNELIHGGQTTIDLAQLLTPLEHLTAELCAGCVIKPIEAAGMIGCSETAVRRYIRDGKLKASKCRGTWHIRPRDLELFMVSKNA